MTGFGKEAHDGRFLSENSEYEYFSKLVDFGGIGTQTFVEEGTQVG